MCNLERVCIDVRVMHDCLIYILMIESYSIMYKNKNNKILLNEKKG